jgi:hypothetical protein
MYGSSKPAVQYLTIKSHDVQTPLGLGLKSYSYKEESSIGERGGIYIGYVYIGYVLLVGVCVAYSVSGRRM